MSIMRPDPDTNECTPSTTIAWEPVKITTAPQGNGTVRRRRSSRPFLARREWRRNMTIVVAYRGGPEARTLVKARGRSWSVPGHVGFLEALVAIWDADEAVLDQDF